MVTTADVKEFWDYINSTCDSEDIDSAVEECGFDLTRLEEEHLAQLSGNDALVLYGDLVYLVLNGPGGGDFETMYEILSDIMGLDNTVIEYLLDF